MPVTHSLPVQADPQTECQKVLALAAAELATKAATELLRFAREGEAIRTVGAADTVTGTWTFAFDEEVTELLARALRAAAEIERRHCTRDSELEALGQIQHAAWRFIEDFGQ